MKILFGQKLKDIRYIINNLTSGVSSSAEGSDWRIESARFQLDYNDAERKFITDCLNKRHNKCQHKNHVGLRYFGTAWHMFCFECGESRFCRICGCGGSGVLCEKHAKETAKVVEYI